MDTHTRTGRYICSHAHVRTLYIPSRHTVFLTLLGGDGFQTFLSVACSTLETPSRMDKAKSPELRSVPKT